MGADDTDMGLARSRSNAVEHSRLGRLAHWPVLPRPRLAGFQVSTEGGNSYQFEYEYRLSDGKHQLSWRHDSYEAMVVRLADDITWVLENLQDANDARILASGGKAKDLFDEIHAEQKGSDDRDSRWGPISSTHSPRRTWGGCIATSLPEAIQQTRAVFQAPAARDKLMERQALHAGDRDAPLVTHSEDAVVTLTQTGSR